MGCGCGKKNKRQKIQKQINKSKNTNALSGNTPGGMPVKDYLKHLDQNKK